MKPLESEMGQKRKKTKLNDSRQRSLLDFVERPENEQPPAVNEVDSKPPRQAPNLKTFIIDLADSEEEAPNL